MKLNLLHRWFGALVESDDHGVTLLRFLAVGGTATLVMMLLSISFSSGFGFPPQVAQGVAHALCIVPTYLCQRAITFRSNVQHRRGLLGYLSMQLPLLGMGVALAWLLIGQMHWPREIGLATIAVIVGATSFLVQRLVIFASKSQK
ncbi:GtrA family protein [Candidatus Viadribacter manganicus]|uniref:GtrA/DPMS transmembrane domain-containing protein n=1 Tax=Candidatus Viadribacter manganicus TaxID=1759059 RepID=A0A1B1AJR4_9PROT|nr:GtrA family protein [Candidatus Viadribacter manganicus]ANP46791.1 hypothetical protein ATE48_13160 [Candidatus Viadribacter manganicus]